MTRFRRKSAALNLVRIIPVWHPQSDRPRQGLCPCTPRGASCPSTPYFYIIIMRRRSRLRPLSSALLLKSMALISLNPRRVKMRELGDGSERRRGESNISAFSRRDLGVPAKYRNVVRTLCGVFWGPRRKNFRWGNIRGPHRKNFRWGKHRGPRKVPQHSEDTLRGKRLRRAYRRAAQGNEHRTNRDEEARGCNSLAGGGMEKLPI